MASVGESIRNIWKIHELRQRILFTLGVLVVYRLGSFVTLPGIDASVLQSLTDSSNNQGGLFGLFNLFVGGAFFRAGVFALGIMPYITASIIIQLMGAVVPYFQKLQREGEDGRQKITQLTRYGTIGITLLQSIGYAINLRSTSGQAIVIPQAEFMVTTVICLTIGTLFVMWLGERITEKGIGNGISLIIMIGIIAFLPASIANEIGRDGSNVFIFLIEVAALFIVTMGVVYVTQGTRRIPVQYAKRVVGRKQMGGTTQYLPLRVNAAGVMPIIFAQSIMFIPSTIAQFFPDSGFWVAIGEATGNVFGVWYSVLFFTICVFFTYFYTAIAVNPQEMADTMKRQGGFIPGVRPGRQTSEFIDTILTRITLPGAIFIGTVAILPSIAAQAGIVQGFAHFFGGTSLLILVGVTLDTLQQVESHLLMRHYDGFMKTGRVRGRRR
ncbi:MAG TPA: preprotein translocase subunit SecY [Rubricoccaceae bacterium]